MDVENIAPLSSKNIKVSNASKSIEQTYTKKTQLEHILLRPDTYIGSVEKQTQNMWVYESESKQVVNKQITYVPGLYKIFDEIIVNAADNKQRDKTMDRIEVTIDTADGSIRVWNNGKGIPVHIHKEHNIYVPELIFGNLLTGSNFDDDEAKTTGGRNGYGAKLANIFSTCFIVETADSERGLKFKQTFKNNMGDKGTPEIAKHSGKDYTCITFYPDLKRFKMNLMDEDIVSLLMKRAYDVAVTNSAPESKLHVYLNGSKIDVRNFEQYISIHKGLEAPVFFERISDRWEIGVGISDGTFQQVSYVNSICTMKGGCHVNYIADQITAKLVNIVKKKNKGAEVKAGQIKNHLAVYVNTLIINPAFDSQTKENLTTKQTSFGSTCTVPDKLVKALEKSPLIDNILSWAKFKQNAELKKKGGSKRSKLFGVTKLDDANFAGTAKSTDCTLILTEGDSAKALAVSGLGVIGRDFYGVFPLKGKLLNVREAAHAQIMKNEEIQNIAKILGLTFGRQYDDVKDLRYGHLMIMTDQDHDGSHIKGLLINFLHYFWPSLLKIDGFLQQFITPIVKCNKGRQDVTFFTIPEYNNWKADHEDGKGWKIKYYKGLGTSTSAEAKDYFSNLPKHEVDFQWSAESDNYIELAFAKKRVDDRKLWLLSMAQDTFINYDVPSIPYDDFVNKELILFSHADNERSIPHFMDGFKPSQRKVLFGCLKRNLKQEIKVAQLAGYISENAAYHHGEVSLTQTIVGMAQNYVGSNNINLLSPCGQFGTRLMGGKDAASARYIFTRLENIARTIFHPSDDPLLEYLDDDGQSIEPVCYVPVIPMLLVNGADGIGTGWSTSVPTYNPRDVIANLRRMIAGEQPVDMQPWYRGFKGSVAAKTGRDSNNFVVSGVIDQVAEEKFVISELPVGKWTTDYKQMLETMIIGAAPAAVAEGEKAAPVASIIKEFKENHTDTEVLFTVTVPAEKCQAIVNEGLTKKFKLETSVSTSNMHTFDQHGQIKKFESPAEILTSFYGVRIAFYEKRKYYLLSKLKEDYLRLENKMRFISSVCNGTLVVSNRLKEDLLNELKFNGYKPFCDSKAKKSKADEDMADEVEEEKASDIERGYDYLLSMKIWSLTKEKVAELDSQRRGKKMELEDLNAKSAEDLWLADLVALEEALVSYEKTFDDAKAQELKAQSRANTNRKVKDGKRVAGGTKKAVKKGKNFDGSSDEEQDDDFESDFDSDFESKKSKKKPAAKAVAKSAASFVALKPAASSTFVPLKPQEKPALVEKATRAENPKERAAPKEKKERVPKEAPVPKVSQVSNLTLSLAERLKLSSGISISAVPAPVAVAKKALGKAKKAKSYDSSSEEEDDDEEEMSFGGDESEEYETDASAPTKIQAKAKPAATKGLKRASRPEGGGGDTIFFSPSEATPKVAKKTKKEPVAKKAPAAKKAPTAKKAPAAKKIVDSDEEDEGLSDESDTSGEFRMTVSKSPKALRQRKQTNYAVFVEDSEVESDQDESEFEEED